MAPPRKKEEEESSEDEDEDATSSDEENPVIARKAKFDDEEDESDVLDSWDAAEDSEVERQKAKKAAEAKTKADAEAAAKKKTKSQRVEEKRTETMRKKHAEEELSEEEEDPAARKARLRQHEQDSDLKHAEDLIGNIGISKPRAETKGVVVLDPNDPTSTIDLATLPLFNPNTKDQFKELSATLVPVLAANAKKAQYTLFMQEFSKQIVKELPSDQIKKIASGLTTLSNEKMKEEKLAEKGGKKSKAAKSKATLVANRDTSFKADMTSYADADDDDDFM